MRTLEHYTVDRFCQAGFTNVYPVPPYDGFIANKLRSNKAIDYGTSSCYYDPESMQWRWLRYVDVTSAITQEQIDMWSVQSPKVKIACGIVNAIEITCADPVYVNDVVSILEQHIGNEFIGIREHTNQTVLLYKSETFFRSGTIEFNNGEYFGKVTFKGLGSFQPMNCTDPYKKQYIQWNKDVVSRTTEQLTTILPIEWSNCYSYINDYTQKKYIVNSYNNKLLTKGAADSTIVEAAKNTLI